MAFIEVELVHDACGGHLRWLPFEVPPTLADVEQRGMALLFQDMKRQAAAERGWPQACDSCGVTLAFEQRTPTGAQKPVIINFDGVMARHA